MCQLSENMDEKNALTSKLNNLKQHAADIITIPKTKLTQASKITHYTTIRIDMEHKQVGAHTLVKDDITFTNIKIQSAIITHHTQLQLVKMHINKDKPITLALDISKAFDAVNIHSLTYKIKQTSYTPFFNSSPTT